MKSGKEFYIKNVPLMCHIGEVSILNGNVDVDTVEPL